MSLLLAVDVGNTNVVLGIFDLDQGPDMNEGGPPGRVAPSASPLELHHVLSNKTGNLALA